MFAHIPAPIEIDDRVATERETFRIVDIAHSYDASVITARCWVTPVGALAALSFVLFIALVIVIACADPSDCL